MSDYIERLIVILSVIQLNGCHVMYCIRTSGFPEYFGARAFLLPTIALALEPRFGAMFPDIHWCELWVHLESIYYEIRLRNDIKFKSYSYDTSRPNVKPETEHQCCQRVVMKFNQNFLSSFRRKKIKAKSR
jgi:hypothetical protein